MGNNQVLLAKKTWPLAVGGEEVILIDLARIISNAKKTRRIHCA